MKVYELNYIKDKGFEFNQYNLLIENNNFYAKLSGNGQIDSFNISLNEIRHFNSLDKYFFLHFFDIREKERQFQRLKKFILNIADNEIKMIEDKKQKIKDSTI